MNNKSTTNKVCPVEKAGALDNVFRRIIQNPNKLLKPYIKKGMNVMDLGCGPGFFTVEMAKLIEGTGKVIAADLQEGMLIKVNYKIEKLNLKNRVILHKCDTNKIGIKQKVDFVLTFYLIHEVPDQESLFRELKEILNTNGKILIVEPRFHVSKKNFWKMIEVADDVGFEIVGAPNVFYSRSVLLAVK